MSEDADRESLKTLAKIRLCADLRGLGRYRWTSHVVEWFYGQGGGSRLFNLYGYSWFDGFSVEFLQRRWLWIGRRLESSRILCL